MRPLDELLKDAAAMHRGCICPGQVLGVRMAMLGCQLLGIDKPTQGKRLIVYVELDRCMADAIAAVTGCRLGKRTLKHMDYGKCACTFVDTQTGRAFRISARDSAREQVWRYVPFGVERHTAQREAYKVMPDDGLFAVQEVTVNIPDQDMPGRPMAQQIAAEQIMGFGITALAYSWAQKDDITGPAPTDPTERQRFYDSGKQPYSVKINGKWIRWQRLGPVAFPMAVGYALSDIERRGGDIHPKYAGEIMAQVGKMFRSMTLVQSLGGIVDSLEDPKGAERLAANITTQLTRAGAQRRQWEKMWDDTVRDPETFYEMVVNGVPFVAPASPSFFTKETGVHRARISLY